MNYEPRPFPTPADAPVGYAVLAIIALYLIVGFALYGPSKRAGLFGKLLYVMLFPAHWLVLTIFSLIVSDHRYITVPLVLIVGGGMMYCSNQSDPGSWICPAAIFVPLFFSIIGSTGRWDEKGNFTDL